MTRRDTFQFWNDGDNVVLRIPDDVLNRFRPEEPISSYMVAAFDFHIVDVSVHDESRIKCPIVPDDYVFSEQRLIGGVLKDMPFLFLRYREQWDEVVWSKVVALFLAS